MTGRELPNGDLSMEFRQLLAEEAAEAEINDAISAALEEGMIVSREEAIGILLSKQRSTIDSTD